MLSGLVQHVHKAKFLLEHHSTTILTGVGVAGTVTTAVLTGRASFKAARLIDDEELTRHAIWQKEANEAPFGDIPPKDMSNTQKVKLVWPLFLPPVAAGAVTITSVVVANRITSKKIAALAVAGGISERALQEYKEKVVEKLGERQDQKIRDEVAQDRVSKTPHGEVIIAGTGDVLCFDMLTGRYFMSSVESIKRAENMINHDMLNHAGASLAEFHDHLGLPSTPYTDKVGWDGADLVKVVLTTTMSQDNRPCIAVDFNRPPSLEWGFRN